MIWPAKKCSPNCGATVTTSSAEEAEEAEEEEEEEEEDEEAKEAVEAASFSVNRATKSAFLPSVANSRFFNATLSLATVNFE